jgi:hypothetical protein
MSTTPSTLPSAIPPTVEDDMGRAAVRFADTGSLGDLTGRLAEVAHAIRVEADQFEELPDLAVVCADIERVLGDLAAAAELTGYAIIDRDRPPGARATQVSPTPPKRAQSPGAYMGWPARCGHRARSVPRFRALRENGLAFSSLTGAAYQPVRTQGARVGVRRRDRTAAAYP